MNGRQYIIAYKQTYNKFNSQYLLVMAMTYSVSTVATCGTCWFTQAGITPDTKKKIMKYPLCMQLSRHMLSSFLCSMS